MKYYKKTYSGFTRFFKKTDEAIYSACVYHDNDEITVIRYHVDSVEINKELKDEGIVEITENEFIDSLILLRKIF